MEWLENGVALVTSGGSRLKRTVTERFVEEGTAVGVMDVATNRLTAVETDFGNDVVAIDGDVTKLDRSVLGSPNRRSHYQLCHKRC